MIVLIAFSRERSIILSELTLTPISATLIFLVGCIAGYQYRRIWQADGPDWQLWLSGLTAAGAFLTVGFVPLSTAG